MEVLEQFVMFCLHLTCLMHLMILFKPGHDEKRPLTIGQYSNRKKLDVNKERSDSLLVDVSWWSEEVCDFNNFLKLYINELIK